MLAPVLPAGAAQPDLAGGYSEVLCGAGLCSRLCSRQGCVVGRKGCGRLTAAGGDVTGLTIAAAICWDSLAPVM